MEQHGVNFDGRFSVNGWRGVAFYLKGWEKAWEPMRVFVTDDDGNEWEQDDPDGEGEWVDDTGGRVVAVMVGDDREHTVDTSDLTELADEDYCSGCGQIGCGWC